MPHAPTPTPEALARRARARAREQQADLVLLIGSVAVVVLSAVLTPSDSVLSLFGWELPGLCLWKNMTGMDCMGCGLTRSFTWMGHGDVVSAFERHKVGPFLYLVVLVQVPIRGHRLVRAWLDGRQAVVSSASEPR